MNCFEIVFAAQVEPGFVALGPTHLAVGMNNRVWFHRLAAMDGTIGRGGGALVLERDYTGTVDEVSQ